VLLLVSFTASAACYSLTASATSMTHLYASRVPTLLQHTVLGARVIVSIASSESNRAAMLGYVGLAYGVGAVVGPSLGGHVSQLTGPKDASWLAAAGSVVSMVSIFLFLPGALLMRMAS
jgi:predicted MFS family arabinose efflux permease